jgi:hypothetical protein|tara:strand:- start:91 stop:378 length:288 start_codon:yes stop_codon:yes gene_type:complete
MFILTIAGTKEEGAYSVADEDGERALYLFEDEDDAARFAGLLEAEDYPEMDVVEVEDEVAINTCNVYNYRYVIISPEEFVIPPREYDFIQKDKMA